MKKTLLTLIAVAFVATSGATFAAKHTKELMEACKDKKPGEMVQVGGKDVKCPKPKKEKK